jgi:hypothetical protein
MTSGGGGGSWYAGNPINDFRGRVLLLLLLLHLLVVVVVGDAVVASSWNKEHVVLWGKRNCLRDERSRGAMKEDAVRHDAMLTTSNTTKKQQRESMYCTHDAATNEERVHAKNIKREQIL